MNEYSEFFKENVVKLNIGRKKIHVKSIDEAKDKFLNYIILNSLKETDLKSKDGELTVDKELIAVFSYIGRLWSTDEEEIIWKNVE